MPNNKINTFLELSDLLYYSIEQGNEELARELISFITKAFVEFRKDKEGNVIIYPDEYYTTIFQANELVCIKPKRTVSYLNGSIFLNLFIDSYQKTIISDKTYNALWVGLRQALNYNRDDVVMSYWKNAHQHFGFFLGSIRSDYKNENGEISIVNQKEIERREAERSKYYEFHLVLGGLLFFLNKFTLLKNILDYTNQTPPVYHLIPGDLNAIINNLLKIKEDYKNPFHFEQMYNFPDIDGINKGALIRYWTKKYLAILFLRQYKLIEYYTYQNIFGLPTIPNSLSEMKEWEQELDIFKNILDKILNNNSVLASLELEELAEREWYKKHNKQYPIDLLDEIISKVKAGYNQRKITQSVSEEKEKEFYDKSKEFVIKSISKLKPLENENEIEQNYTTVPLNGTCELFDKTAFSDDQDVSYLNADTIVAQSISGNLSLSVTWSFLNFIKDRYSFKPETIFEAIDKMGFDLNYYSIISFGVYLKHYTDFLNIKKLEERNGEFYYKNCKIIDIDNYIHPNLIGSLIVIKKEELPKLVFNELSKEDKEKYNPKLLDKDYSLYAKIIDLNEHKGIVDNITISNVDDLKQKVLACILFNWEIKWKNSTQIYQFKVFEQFSNSGKPNSFDDLNVIEKEDD